MVSVISPDSPGLASARNRRGVTPLVTLVNFVRPVRGEVGEHPVPEQPAVQLGDPVDLELRDRGQVRHPDRPFRVLLDDRHPADRPCRPGGVARTWSRKSSLIR